MIVFRSSKLPFSNYVISRTENGTTFGWVRVFPGLSTVCVKGWEMETNGGLISGTSDLLVLFAFYDQPRRTGWFAFIVFSWLVHSVLTSSISYNGKENLSKSIKKTILLSHLRRVFNTIFKTVFYALTLFVTRHLWTPLPPQLFYRPYGFSLMSDHLFFPYA